MYQPGHPAARISRRQTRPGGAAIVISLCAKTGDRSGSKPGGHFIEKVAHCAWPTPSSLNAVGEPELDSAGGCPTIRAATFVSKLVATPWSPQFDRRSNATRVVAPTVERGGVITAPLRHHIRHPTTTLCNGACAPFVLGWALEETQPPATIGTCLNLPATTAATDSAHPCPGRRSHPLLPQSPSVVERPLGARQSLVFRRMIETIGANPLHEVPSTVIVKLEGRTALRALYHCAIRLIATSCDDREDAKRRPAMPLRKNLERL